jgi:hypothetical protein
MKQRKPLSSFDLAQMRERSLAFVKSGEVG